MAAQCYFLCLQNVIQLQVSISHGKGKQVNYGHCSEKGSCLKEIFCTKKKGFFYIKGLPNVTFCVQKVIQLQVPISHAKGKLVNYGHCFEKGSSPKENFLHKKGIFLHKRAAQCYFLCVQKIIQLQVPILHAKGKLVNYGHCFEKGSCLKEIFGTKRDFST